MTHAEIANELGVSRQYIQHIEKNALQKLRNNKRVKIWLSEHIGDVPRQTIWEIIESMAIEK
jgi:DNA-binding XRE family transcriptional regulator